MTYNERAIAMFRSSPHVWFGARELQDQLGFCAWRSRVSDARRRGLNIKNRQIRTPEGRILSFYSYEPSEEPTCPL